ncbi:MAG: hypothetical protein OEW87_13090 [Flavobacteriaceae bacterium]|nr:hypothetical protein [Flavobacteriaceae bacterium]
MRKLIVSIGCCILLTAFIIEGYSYDERTQFINSAIERFEKSHVMKDEIELLRQKLADWMKSGFNEEEWIDIANTVYIIAKSNDVKSKVIISTYPNDKATIKYQTYGQRSRGDQPTTAKELTTCEEDMYIGVYYIWSEREGEATSDKDKQYNIVDKIEEVEIAENN